MKPQSTIDGPAPTNRYRLPSIEREGIAQLSLLETALSPLQGGKLHSPMFETSYAFSTPTGRETAHVTVRSALGLQPIDEFVLWGLLGATLSKLQPDPVLLATPYWMLRHLGLATGGYQYGELRGSLLRLATTSYQNTGFYNPESQEHEHVAFQFLSLFLPTVGGLGERVDNDRCWRIEWNPAFFRFCRMTGGNLLFDLELYQSLSPASRRLFLKLKDRFWRSKRVFLNVDDLTINGLGFSASRPLYKRKFDLLNCIRELLEYQVIALGKGQAAPKDLFIKHGKGSYVVLFHEGEYFRHPLAGRTIREKNAIADDPLYEPLRKIGVDQAGIRRIFEQHSKGLIKRWVRITDAAMHEKPRGFPGFKVSPAAFFIDGISHERSQPDWVFAHEKKQGQDQWERERSRFAQDEQVLLHRYNEARSTALREYLASEEGRKKYQQTNSMLLELYKRTEPNRYQQAAHEAAVARIEKLDFQFPEYAAWVFSQPTETGQSAE
jgi:hypothetical protein